MNGLSITDIHKTFGETTALSGISFKVTEGDLVALLGPSGCGKSTLLNIIAGLETPDRGEITWNGQSLRNIPPHRRDFGLMFQDYMLFPHKNAGANVAFGLEMADWTRDRIEARVTEILGTVGLANYAHRDVNTLSGGEQQRVALARSLAPHPRLLMLDEPLGALDRALRERLLGELGTLLRSMRQTALYVTHDQEEAFALADRVVVMNHGLVAQIGTPQEIYRQPASEFVARFLGFANIIAGEFRDGKLRTKIGEFDSGKLAGWVKDPQQSGLPLQRTVLLRPDAMHLDGTGTHRILGRVAGWAFRGSLCRIIVDIEGTALTFEFPSAGRLPETGDSIELSFFPNEAIQILS